MALVFFSLSLKESTKIKTDLFFQFAFSREFGTAMSDLKVN